MALELRCVPAFFFPPANNASMGYFNTSGCVIAEEERTDGGRGERANLAVTVFSRLMNEPPPTSKQFWLCYCANLEYSSRGFFPGRAEAPLRRRSLAFPSTDPSSWVLLIPTGTSLMTRIPPLPGVISSSGLCWGLLFHRLGLIFHSPLSCPPPLCRESCVFAL